MTSIDYYEKLYIKLFLSCLFLDTKDKQLKYSIFTGELLNTLGIVD